MTALIVDVGMHRCEDTDYYLARGYRVVAVEPNPALVDLAQRRHAHAVASGQLVVLSCALTDQDLGSVEFNVSDTSQWSSIRTEVSTRLGRGSKPLVVATRTLASVLREFGLPLYCKIDAAGHERVCLATLSSLPELPPFLSVQTECLGQGEVITEEAALATLRQLVSLGYRSFKLVDQSTLSVLHPERRFYFAKGTAPEKLLWVIKRSATVMRQRRYLGRLQHRFQRGASGPFGEDLNGSWSDAADAAEMLLRHRRDFFGGNTANAARSFSFWCDWHARR